MQPSTSPSNPAVPMVQILVSGRGMIRLYQGDKCVGFAESYHFAQVRAAELEHSKQHKEIH